MVDGSTHHILRFTAAIWNAGPGALELRGVSSEGSTQAYQRIYDEAGGVSERLVGQFVFHPGHNHWHFESFAEYELWTKADYDRWISSGRQEGQARWRGSKTTGQGESFCLRDSQAVENLPDSPSTETYGACDTEIQGISVGWADVYPFYLDEQWIDLGRTKLRPGRYVLRVVADPRNLLYESENGSDLDRESARANEAAILIRIRGDRAETLRDE
jgi:hypothetical protein